MPKKGAKKTAKRTSTRGPVKKSKIPQPTKTAAAPDAAASTRYVQDLLVRGEAVKRNQDGTVPKQATHAIKRKNPDGSVEVERVRFKAF